MKVLKRTLCVVAIIVLSYWLGYFVLKLTPLCYRSWVNLLGKILTWLVLPLLCILIAIMRLGTLIVKRKLLAIIAGVIIAGAFLYWSYWVLLITMYSYQEERWISGNLLVTNEAGFLEENRFVYYRPMIFFFKLPFEFDKKSHIEYLEEKYNVSFIVVDENLYVNEEYPTVEVSVNIQDSDMVDNYVNAMWVYYFEMWYKESCSDRKYYVQNNQQGLPDFVYLQLKSEDDMESLSRDVSDLMQYVASETDFFQDYYVSLYFYYEIDEKRLIGHLPFGDIEEWGEVANDYYLYPEQVLERIRAGYENGIESLPKKEENKVELEETDGKEQVEAETTPEQRIEGMARLVFDEILAEEDYIFQVKYNAKGNLYIDLGSVSVGGQEYNGKGAYYRFTLVYDRTSKNGLCELFVLYREHYAEDGINDTTTILDMYAVEKESGKVIMADKQS